MGERIKIWSQAKYGDDVTTHKSQKFVKCVTDGWTYWHIHWKVAYRHKKYHVRDYNWTKLLTEVQQFLFWFGFCSVFNLYDPLPNQTSVGDGRACSVLCFSLMFFFCVCQLEWVSLDKNVTFYTFSNAIFLYSLAVCLATNNDAGCTQKLKTDCTAPANNRRRRSVKTRMF